MSTHTVTAIMFGARFTSGPTPDYWKDTEGNAKAALMQLIALAKLRPDGVWKGD